MFQPYISLIDGARGRYLTATRATPGRYLEPPISREGPVSPRAGAPKQSKSEPSRLICTLKGGGLTDDVRAFHWPMGCLLGPE